MYILNGHILIHGHYCWDYLYFFTPKPTKTLNRLYFHINNASRIIFIRPRCDHYSINHREIRVCGT